MKKITYLILITIPLFALWFFTSSSSMKHKDVADLNAKKEFADNKKVAVLELFTSQGCSSCPPADRLLGTYTSKENVITLSFHVDYWNRLGWKDPFSSKEFTNRQYNYASALHASVYTPQLVINGESEMVGSDADKISSTIKKIAAQTPDAAINIKEVKAENGKALISFDASGNINNSVVHIALVEKKTVTDIKAGENGGVTLTNYNVVRNFATVDNVSMGANNSSINIPSSFDVKNSSIVVFLQNKNNDQISAASQASF